MSELYKSLFHSKWNCKYPVVFIPKHHRNVLYGEIQRHLGPIFHELARQKECRIPEGHLMPDHVHICIEIPPKYPVASIIGFLKGKSAIAVVRQFCGKVTRSATSQANTSGPAAMRSRRCASNWSRSAPISTSKTARQAQNVASKLAAQARRPT